MCLRIIQTRKKIVKHWKDLSKFLKRDFDVIKQPFDLQIIN